MTFSAAWLHFIGQQFAAVVVFRPCGLSVVSYCSHSIKTSISWQHRCGFHSHCGLIIVSFRCRGCLLWLPTIVDVLFYVIPDVCSWCTWEWLETVLPLQSQTSSRNFWLWSIKSLLKIPCQKWCHWSNKQYVEQSSSTSSEYRMWCLLGIFDFCQLTPYLLPMTADILLRKLLCWLQKVIPCSSAVPDNDVLSSASPQHVWQLWQRVSSHEY